MNLMNLTSNYHIKRIKQQNFNNESNQIFSLCASNPKYYEYTHETLSLQNLKDDLLALPPKKTEEDKYFIGFYNDEKLIAILDLIQDYPKEEIAYIGLFMTHKSLQGTGLGTEILRSIESFLVHENYKTIQLGVVHENLEAKYFWEKNGFTQSGESIIQEKYTVIPMIKSL